MADGTPLSHSDDTSLVGKVMSTIEGRIAARSLTPGAKLPSIRALAETLGVSKSTVVTAYDRLAAEGTIQSRPGSGFYVAAPLAPLAVAELGPRLDREVDPFWISRQALEAGPDVLMPGCGWLPDSWMPHTDIRRALRALARGDTASLVEYGSPRGLPALRQIVARRLAERGIETAPDHIVLTDSGTQAIDLVCRFLVEPGDTVLLDDPGYFNFQTLLRSHRVKIVGVPYTPAGPDVKAFAEILEREKPRLYITNSGLHNPTGVTLSPTVVHQILKLAERAGLTILEDDVYADLEVTPGPRLATFDGLENVIHLGSFSKTLTAAGRCGFIAARPEWIEALVDLRISTTFGGGRLTSEIMLHLLRSASYRRHVEGVRTRLAEAMARTADRLARIGIDPWTRPAAGMFLWCRLPGDTDAAELARFALRDNVVLAPGNTFSPSQSARSFARFNVAQCDDPRIYDVLERGLERGPERR